MEIPTRIAALLARALFAEASAEELQELEAFRAANPEFQQWQETLEKLAGKTHTQTNQFKSQSIKSRQKLQQLIERARSVDEAALATNTTGLDEKAAIQGNHVVNIGKTRGWWKYAAVLVITATLYLLLKPAGKTVAEVNDTASAAAAGSHTISAEKGSRTRAMLPDGTKIWLNAGSSISYTNSYNDTLREVKLQGEAFFDVVKNARCPFIVHAGSIDVRVLGTAFNVKSYEGDSTVETTLLRGAVEVTTQYNKSNKIFLKPDQKLIVPVKPVHKENSRQKESQAPEELVAGKTAELVDFGKKSNMETLEETAWVYNRLVFKNDNFEMLAGKLSRWYNVEIVFEDEEVKQLPFTGSFEDETIEDAMIALQKVTPFTYKKIANEIHIYSRK